ncbi:hypothetical protein [Actinomadura sp. WMMA1423]|uniref:GAP1-N2 domain-containing protein n=1 Tax=Actinomadura sp. WMMA1423 TaxID=2591108 RepID=UPI00114799E0|nr:hypothetical protein [Actinomadura sp. WMMA1423]
MAWQLHYTSARRGPTGRAGFQFVAETPGLPDGTRAAVTPYLSYRPPPDAPLSPGDAELELFPVSLLYDEVDGRPLLLRCRYLGRDYSGRYGNFFAHAVVAEPEELEGLRPAELWQAAHWTPLPAPGGVLEPVEELTPGAALDPEALAGWLASAGPGDPYALLAHLVDAVAGVLGRGHGRVVLIADDVELIARWIAVVSYSLPVAAAARLSFTTYTADPDGAAQRLVGTTPAVWATAQNRASHASVFDLRRGAPEGRASRFARTVAGCWRDRDLGGLDALAELAPPDDPAREGAAALLALSRGDATVTAGEEGAAAELLARRGTGLPAWVWRDLVAGVPSMGLDLTLAVHARARESGAADLAARCALRVGGLVSEALAGASRLAEVAGAASVAERAGAGVDPGEVAASAARCVRGGPAELAEALTGCPAGLRDALLDGIVAGLAGSGERAAALTPDNCDLLYAHAERLRAAPGVAVPVLASVGRRRAGRRIAVTAELLRLDGCEPGAVDAAVREVWAAPPSAAECLELLDAWGAEPPPAALAELPSRTFARLAGPGGDGLAEPAALRLAERVRALAPDGRAGRDAALVQAYGMAITADPPRAARALESLADAQGATERLAREAFADAALRLSPRPPGFRAELLAAVPAPVRARLAARWTGELPGRVRAGHAPLRGQEVERRNELVEVVLRLRRLGAGEPALESWARAAARRWLAAKQLDAHLASRPELRAELRDLLAEDAT